MIRAKRKHTRFIHGFSYALVLSAAIILGVVSWKNDKYAFEKAELETVRDEALEIKAKLQSVIGEYELMTRSLSVALELRPDMSQAEFTEASQHIRGQDPDVINVASVQDYVIRLVHPYDQNAGIIGRDLRDIPAQARWIERAVATQRLTVHGPVDLLQGGQGLIFRSPVNSTKTSEADRAPLSDFASIVVRTEKFFAAARFSEHSGVFEVAIRVLNEDSSGEKVVYGDSETFSRLPVVETVTVGGASWEVAVIPRHGWNASYNLPVHWFVIIAIASGFTFLSVARLQRENARAEQAETAAKTAMASLETAIEALPEGFLLFDAESRLTLFNKKCLELYEATAPAIRIGATLEEIVRYGLDHGEYVDAIGREDEWLKEQQSRLHDGETKVDYQVRNGTWIQSYNVRTGGGGRVGLRVDITRLRQQQIMLEEANAELREALRQRDQAEQRFFDIARVSKDWFWEQDSDLRFTYLSSGFERLVNIDTSRLLGKTRWEVITQGQYGTPDADLEWLKNQQEARLPFDNFVYPMQVDDGSTKWIRTSGAPVFDEDGNFCGYRGVGSDITVLYEALNDAKAASTAKSEFLSVISHELRTPLTVLLGYTAFLKRPGLLPAFKRLKSMSTDHGTIELQDGDLEAGLEEISAFAEKMESSGQHLLGLINELLDLSKIESGEITIHPEDFSLDTLIQPVAEQFSELAARKGLELIIDTGDSRVFADKKRLGQVLINLIGNAIKFTDCGSVRIESRSVENEICMSVTDTGPGIPPEKQETIFDRFKQLENAETRKTGGTGLGLTITRHLVELQRGRIEVVSQDGGGSTFIVYLPSAAEKNKLSAKPADAMS